MLKSFNSDQVRQYVRPDLGPSCLPLGYQQTTHLKG